MDANNYRVHAIRADILRHPVAKAMPFSNTARATVASPVADEGILYPVQLRINLAELYRDNDDEKEAAQELKTALSTLQSLQVPAPRRPEYLRMRGTVKAGLGDLAGADTDLQQAVSLAPKDVNILLQYGGVQWKLGARTTPTRLTRKFSTWNRITPRPSRLWDTSRVTWGTFRRRRTTSIIWPRWSPRVRSFSGLGDMYTSLRRLTAQQAYEKAYSLDHESPLIIAGGRMQGSSLTISDLQAMVATGQRRGIGEPLRDARAGALFEMDRQLRGISTLGEQVIQKLPKDRDAVVYLGYDLLALDRYEDLLGLTSRYIHAMPKEPDLPLLAGYIYKQNDLLQEAYEAFSETLRRDPKVVTAYVNRGYVLNDLQNGERASADFEQALKLSPTMARLIWDWHTPSWS